MLTDDPRACATLSRTTELFFQRLGKNTNWINSFLTGADGQVLEVGYDKRAYKLGKAIRIEYQVWR